MNDVYITAYGEACDRHFASDVPRDLRAWGELLSRHGLSLRMPRATDRPLMIDDDGDGDGLSIPASHLCP